MGQAKRRGTYEQRKTEGIERKQQEQREYDERIRQERIQRETEEARREAERQARSPVGQELAPPPRRHRRMPSIYMTSLMVALTSPSVVTIGHSRTIDGEDSPND
jgi:hypothetical protein